MRTPRRTEHGSGHESAVRGAGLEHALTLVHIRLCHCRTGRLSLKTTSLMPGDFRRRANRRESAVLVFLALLELLAARVLLKRTQLDIDVELGVMPGCGLC